MKKLILVVLTTLVVLGCTPYVERLQDADGIENVKVQAMGYVTYTTDNGTVTCREHTRRSELSCWNTKK